MDDWQSSGPGPVTTRRRATVVDIRPEVGGGVAAIRVAERTHGPGGTPRTFVQEVLVRDGSLRERLARTVRTGDVLEVTVVTEFHEAGYVTYLVGF